jgi:regulation of enolase protein 1 (concanavalin A-like superfamily)
VTEQSRPSEPWEPFLDERFTGPRLDGRLRWFCEPARWSADPAGRCLRVEPDAATDFWRKTHYGFEVDNGHLLSAELSGDFLLSTRVRFRPVHQYDQAGLMVRVSPTCWLKTSVEYEPDGPARLGAVVTNAGYSDWSTQDFPSGHGELGLRVQRSGGDYLAEASADGRDWKQIRVARLHDDGPGVTLSAGLYACSPKGAGFVAEFEHLRIDTRRAR